MTRPPAWVCYALIACSLVELILAVMLSRWYVDLLIDQYHRL